MARSHTVREPSQPTTKTKTTTKNDARISGRRFFVFGAFGLQCLRSLGHTHSAGRKKWLEPLARPTAFRARDLFRRTRGHDRTAAIAAFWS